MADVTERWSGRAGYVQGEQGNRAWDIDGDEITNEEEARAALLAAYPDAGQNQPFPIDASLRSPKMPQIDPSGPASWIGRQTYVPPPNGTFTPVESDPIRRPPKFFWRSGRVEEESHLDANGVPMTDTAGTPFSPPLKLSRVHRFLTVTRWESFYDLAKADEYEGTVSDSQLVIPLTPGPLAAGRIMLLSYQPLEGYDRTATRVPVQYDFELWRGNVEDDDGLWDAFKFRVLSAGYTGWYDDSGTKRRGRIVHLDESGDWNLPSSPVPLDGQGRPTDTNSYRIRPKGGGAPVEAAQVPDAFAVVADLQEQSSGYYFLKFAKAVKKNFAGLNVF